MQLNDHQIRNIRSNWQLQAHNCLLAGEQVPLPPEPLLKCSLNANESAQWRGAVAAAIRGCRDIPPLPDEWKSARAAQQNAQTTDTLGRELTQYREQLARAAALGDQPNDASETVAPPAPNPKTILNETPGQALTRHRNEQQAAALR
jgi:hypothetical protein